MRVRKVAACLTLLVVGGAADASAQTFGGGSLPYLASPRSFDPSIMVTLQQRPAGLGLRFETTILCGRSIEEVTGRKVVPFDGSSFQASGATILRSGRVRADYAWTISGAVSGQTAGGTLRITGRRRLGRGRWVACRRRPERSFQARLAAQPTGAPTAAPGRMHHFGTSDVVVADGHPGAVVVRTSSNGRRFAALWSVMAPCGRERTSASEKRSVKRSGRLNVPSGRGGEEGVKLRNRSLGQRRRRRASGTRS